jgi:hypothetical protein
VLGCPLATRLTLCTWAEAEVVLATTTTAITDQRQRISSFLKSLAKLLAAPNFASHKTESAMGRRSRQR